MPVMRDNCQQMAIQTADQLECAQGGKEHANLVKDAQATVVQFH